MARVPQYQQSVEVQNLPNVREVNPITPDVLGAGIGRAMQQAGGVASNIADREREKADIAALMQADREMADLELELFHNPQTGAYTRRGQDAFGTPEQVFPQWDKRVSAIEQRLTPQQRTAFQRQAGARRSDLQRGLARHITTESDRFYAAEADASVASAAAAASANYTDPDRVALEADRATRAALSLDDGASPIVQQQRVAEAQAGVYAAALTRRLQDDPVGAIAYYRQIQDKLTPGQIARIEPVIREAQKTEVAFNAADRAIRGEVVGSTFDSAVTAVLEIEGGYVADDAGAGPTNYGINSRANPGVDVANLTPDQARAVYREKYWDAINADELPASMRGMAFDAAVNQGVGNAKKWLAEANGDPQRFLELRGEHYESLIEKNPGKYAQFAESWENRLARFQPREDTEAPSLSQALGRLDYLPPEERKLAESRVRQEWAAVEQAKKEASDARLNEGYAWIQQGGSVASLPPELRARMEPTEIANVEQYERVRQANGGAVKTDMKVYADLLDQAVARPLEFATRSLVDLQPSLSDSDYRALLKAQTEIKAGRPAALQAERKLVTEVSTPILRDLGIVRPVKGAPTRSQTVKGQEARYEMFVDAVQREVESFKGLTGKDPTVADVEAIVDRLVIAQTVEVPGVLFGTNEETRFAFEADKPPRDAGARVTGRIYSTPKGPMRWTGTGWTATLE